MLFRSQQIKESLQQRVEGETAVVALLSQCCQHSVKPYSRDKEDNEDDEDKDALPPRRQKQRHIKSDATETATS